MTLKTDKSVLAKIIAGFHFPQAGETVVYWPDTKTSFVYQGLPELTGLEPREFEGCLCYPAVLRRACG